MKNRGISRVEPVALKIKVGTPPFAEPYHVNIKVAHLAYKLTRAHDIEVVESCDCHNATLTLIKNGRGLHLLLSKTARKIKRACIRKALARPEYQQHSEQK
jgi:hypothetical protein